MQPTVSDGPALRPAQATALTDLVDELGELAEWPAVEVDAALLLFDVLSALEASRAEMADILGDDACRYVKHQLDETARMDGTATVPYLGAACVPSLYE